jgi:hypothetical protein
MKITGFDKATCKAFDAALGQTLRKFAADHGVEVEMRGGTFGAGNYKPRVEFRTADAGQKEWERYADMFGLPKDAFGKTFQRGNSLYTISGLSISASRFPVITKRQDGVEFKFPVVTVLQGLK